MVSLQTPLTLETSYPEFLPIVMKAGHFLHLSFHILSYAGAFNLPHSSHYQADCMMFVWAKRGDRSPNSSGDWSSAHRRGGWVLAFRFKRLNTENRAWFLSETDGDGTRMGSRKIPRKIPLEMLKSCLDKALDNLTQFDLLWVEV